jgi:REP element-mobilizing transposase RayT
MKNQPDEYRRNPHSVTLLNYHFVFCPKRRKKVLVGEIEQRLQEIIFGLCKENNWRLIACEIRQDHVHLFLNTDPTYAPSAVVKKIKGRASHYLIPFRSTGAKSAADGRGFREWGFIGNGRHSWREFPDGFTRDRRRKKSL